MSKSVDKNVFLKHRRVKNNSIIRHKTHGMTDTSLYYIWCSMKQRCKNKNNPKWNLYGGRGIQICKMWEQSFDNFMKWALTNGYRVGLTIDRISSNGNYCPENCRWATVQEQNHNLRSNVNITFGGKTMCLSEWADYLNIDKNTLYSRIRIKGWSVEKALTTPVNKSYRRNYKK